MDSGSGGVQRVWAWQRGNDPPSVEGSFSSDVIVAEVESIE